MLFKPLDPAGRGRPTGEWMARGDAPFLPSTPEMEEGSRSKAISGKVRIILKVLMAADRNVQLPEMAMSLSILHP